MGGATFTGFVTLPVVTWHKEHRKWSEPKQVRIRLDDIRRYERWDLSEDQRSSTNFPVTKVVYQKSAEQAGDAIAVKTALLIVCIDCETLDRRLGHESL